MTSKNQLIAIAKKHNVKIEIVNGSDPVVEMDAWGKKFRNYGDHGFTASGETMSEAITDAFNIIKEGFIPCGGCTDSYCTPSEQ